MSEAPSPSAKRRTQAERSASTVAKLVEATVDTIFEVGYHRASVGAICARAGVSKDGLFRHFDSRTALVIAAAEEIGRRHIDAFRALPAGQSVADLLRFIRARTRTRDGAVWYELLVAARTEPELREKLSPVVGTLCANVAEAAAAVFAPAIPADLAALGGLSAVHLFDGEALMGFAYRRPDLEEPRVQVAAVWVEGLAGSQ